MPQIEVGLPPEFQRGQRGIEIDGHDSELEKLMLQIRLEEIQERKLKMQLKMQLKMESARVELETEKVKHQNTKLQHEHEEKMATIAVEKVKAEAEAKKLQHEHEEKMATLAIETLKAEAEKLEAEAELLRQRNEERWAVEEESFLERLRKKVSAILVGIWNAAGDYWGKLNPVLIDKLVEETIMLATKAFNKFQLQAILGRPT